MSELGDHTGSTWESVRWAKELENRTEKILDYMAHDRGGFNNFRGYRLTHLEKPDCPEPLKHFWSGHAAKDVSERYVKLGEDGDFRLMCAERISLGFELPETAKVGHLGNGCNSERRSKLLKGFVDDMGFEPTASLLRSRRLDSSWASEAHIGG